MGAQVTTRRVRAGRLDVFVAGVRKGYVTSYLGAHRAFDTAGRLIEDRARGFQGHAYGLRGDAVDAVAHA